MNQSIKNTTGKQLRTNEVAMTMNASSKQFSDQNGTVKNRFQILQAEAEDLLKSVEEEVNFINDFSLSLTKKIEEEKLKPQQYVKEATVKLNKLEEQIGKHFEHQKNENDKMTKEITELKGDTTSIEQSLIGSFKVTRGYCDWLNSLGNRIGVVTYIDGTGQASMNAN